MPKRLLSPPIERSEGKIVGMFQMKVSFEKRIKMKKKTSFYTDLHIYYLKMSFEYKNIKTTYQHLIDKIFKNQIRRNIEVYIDNMVIKSANDTALL